MDIEKLRQYANSKIKTDKMRKEIKDTLDEYKTTQRMGYEAAKTQFKPLLEAQAAQTKAQEAQTKAQETQAKAQIEATNQLQKTSGLTKETQDFIIDNGFLTPATLLNYGKEAFNTNKEEEWKEHMLNLSIYLGNLVEQTNDPKIKKAAAEYRKQLKDVVSALFKYKRKESTTPQPEWTDNFNNYFTDEELLLFNNWGLTSPQQVYNEGLNAKKQSPELYQKWNDKTTNLRDKLAGENRQSNITKEDKDLRKRYYNTLVEIMNKTKRVTQRGAGRNRKKFTMGSGIIFTKPQEMFKKLELITGSIIAGNDSKKIRNDAYKIIDKLLEIGLITKTIYNKYIKEYLKH